MSALSKQKIIIAGAGLGGLSAAACLIQDGHDVQIYEQAPQLGEIGAGSSSALMPCMCSII